MSSERILDPTTEPKPTLRRSVLFVCTGNTCRSPLAEMLCKKMLAERLGIRPEDLPTYGYLVRSAGVSAFAGDCATVEGVSVAAAFGVDLSTHRSRPVNPELLSEATDVIAMTASHLALLTIRYPGYGPEPVLLCGTDDLPDPIGGGLTEYEACASQIVTHLERIIADWTRS